MKYMHSQILMLSDWHKKNLDSQSNWKVNKPIVVFCSFLNHESLIAALNMFKYYYENYCIENQEVYHYIEYVFFPVSLNSSENDELFKKIKNLLEFEMFSKDETTIRKELDSICSHALSLVYKNYEQFLIKELENGKKSKLKDREKQKYENIGLFGEVAANYLEDIVEFPTIFIKEEATPIYPPKSQLYPTFSDYISIVNNYMNVEFA